MDQLAFLPSEHIPLIEGFLWTRTWRFCLGFSGLILRYVCAGAAPGMGVLEWNARPGISGCKQQRFQIPQGRKKVCLFVLLLFCFSVWFGWNHSLTFVLMLAQEQQQYQDPEATGLPESGAQGLL